MAFPGVLASGYQIEAAGYVGVSPLIEKVITTVLTERWIEHDDPPTKEETNHWRDIIPVDSEGRVVHADGMTPAVGAIVLIVEPKSEYILRQAHTDALGQFRTQRAYTFGQYRLDAELQNSPAESVMVAFLPGQCGATILPISEFTGLANKTIRLPKPILVGGKVTVGGKSASLWNDRFRVLAAYEGRGSLDNLLSISVIADADGYFELAGLTPGRYRIQSAMDDLWLSPSRNLIVAATDVKDAGSHSLLLDVGLPGAPSVIRCVDNEGKSLAGDVRIYLHRPPGPLTDRLWPTTFVSDGAGIVNVPPLETGQHQFRVRKDGVERSLLVNELLPDHKLQNITLTTD
jgi:hypothetical protein